MKISIFMCVILDYNFTLGILSLDPFGPILEAYRWWEEWKPPTEHISTQQQC